MNKLSLLATVLVILLSVSACVPKIIPSGRITTETIPFGQTISKLEVGSGIKVILDPNASPNTLSISTHENIHRYIVVEQRQGTLNIFVDTYGMSLTSFTITVTLSPEQFTSYTFSGGVRASSTAELMQPFVSVELSGGSRFEADINADKVNMELSGGSRMIGGIYCSDIFLELSGGSRMEIIGTSNNFNANCSGGSLIDGLGHTCNNLDLVSSGGSIVKLTVLESIICDNSGGSKLFYSGDPDKIIINSSADVIPV